MSDLNLILVVYYLFTSTVVLINQLCFIGGIIIGLYCNSNVIHVCIKCTILYIYIYIYICIKMYNIIHIYLVYNINTNSTM